MRKRLRTFLKVMLILVTLLTVNFAVRAYNHSQRFRARSDEPIQAWMTIPFIAHSHHVPPHVLHDAIGIPREPRERRPLWQIAQEQGRPAEELIVEIKQAIIDSRALEPPAPPPVPPPPTELLPP